MATINKAIKKINGLPLADLEARATLESLNLTNKFSGKKWAIFGDSISQPNTDGLDKYYNIIGEKLNIETISYAVGGSGYFKSNSSAGYGANNIIDRINNASTGFDIISLMAGVNEHTLTMGAITDEVVETPTTLCGAVKKSIELVIEKYPNAQIFLMTSTPGTGNLATINQTTLNTYANNQIEIAKMYNIPVLDLYHMSGLRPWNDTNLQTYYGGNYVHLNAKGHQYIAQIIQKFMENNLVFL